MPFPPVPALPQPPNIPNFFEIYEILVALLVQVFGTDLDTDPSSPTGQQLNLLANSFLQLYEAFAATYAASRVQQAQAQALDDLLALINVFRVAGTQTIVPNVNLTGTPSTIIPAGSLAQTSSGNQFYSGSEVTLDVSGNGSCDFYAVNVGAIVVNIGDLNQIVQPNPITGWTGVNNPVPGITGSATESDLSLRQRQAQLINQYSLGYLGAIRSVIFQSTAVLDVYIHENDTNSTDSFGAPAHSLWCIIYYNDQSQEQAIAQSIFRSKAAVSVYADNTNMSTFVSKTVNDISGHPHTIVWNKAIQVPLYIDVQVLETKQLQIDVPTTIKKTLVDYVNNTAKIGGTIYYFDIVCRLASIDPNLHVEHFYISTTNPPAPTDVVDIEFEFTEVATLIADNIDISYTSP